MSRVLFLCPTHDDYREIGHLNGAREDTFFFHDYATELEDLVAEEPPAKVRRIQDPEAEIERILKQYGEASIDCIVSTDDYPGSALASIVARALGLPGVDPSVNLLCQHKYHARRAQRAVIPDATPDFRLIDCQAAVESPSALGFPFFIKPVKSLFSVGAHSVDSPEDFPAAVRRATLPRPFFDPFETLFKKYSGLEMEGYVLAEALLVGQQSTLEGYAYKGEIHVLGIVDSIMFPGTISFRRFEYPSQLLGSLQERIASVAQKVMSGIGYDNGLFNIEFIYNPMADSIHVIEINPRMSSQFADLFEKVDGTNTYTILLDLASSRKPHPNKGAGRHAFAACCVLRTFQNKKVVKLPSAAEVHSVIDECPDMRIEIVATKGKKFSQQMQDACSYQYGLVNIGGRDRADILEIFDHCVRKLTFVFERVKGAGFKIVNDETPIRVAPGCNGHGH